MGKGIQATQAAYPKNNGGDSGDHPPTRRRPAGRKPGPAPEFTEFGRQLHALIHHCFPDLNRWLDALPDPRRKDLCTYEARHLWWQILLTFLLRGGSRNAFDADRNSGQLPENLLQLCAQQWDPERLGDRRTVTCSENAKRHASRVPVSAVAELLMAAIRRLIQMRTLEQTRLFDRWWRIAIDGTLQDRGRDTPQGEGRYRYTVEAKLVGPANIMLPMMTEFVDMNDPVREKEDCELNAFRRMAARLHKAFPRLPICLLMDGLYPVQTVFDLCQEYDWKFIITLKEGRQPTAWDEAVQTTLMNPGHLFRYRRKGEHGPVEQTFRWTHQVPFGKHAFQVLFCGEISPVAATLWCWVTNFKFAREQVQAIANQGGRARNGIETAFNVQKNGGFGLEHAFCANPNASQNYHLMMQLAHILGQLLVVGVLRRLTQACRKLTDRKLMELLRTSLMSVRIDPARPAFGQLRFQSSA